MTRPKRRTIPIRVKRAVVERQAGFCKCGCGQMVSAEPKTDTTFDHEPALRLRDVNPGLNDYIPPQHSQRHIDALRTACHHIKTHGTGATTAGTDIGKIKKARNLARGGKTVRHPMPKPHKRKWPSRTFQKRVK